MSEFPDNIIANSAALTSEKFVVLTPEVTGAFGPDIDIAEDFFKTADNQVTRDLWRKMNGLHRGLYSFKTDTGAKIDYSLIYGKGTEILLRWAQGAPRSRPEPITQWMLANPHDQISKNKAKPHSWGSIAQSSVLSDVLKSKAVNREMPVLTIFTPLPSFPHKTYRHKGYDKIRRGDFTPAAQLAALAIAAAQEKIHGALSETQFDRVHLDGALLDAANSVGAASGLLRLLEKRDLATVASVTAPELVIGPKSVIRDLGPRIARKSVVGAASKAGVGVIKGNPLLREPLMSKKLGDGVFDYERGAKARDSLGVLAKATQLKGLTRPERNRLPRHIEHLLENKVQLLLPLGANSGLSNETQQYVSDPKAHFVEICAIPQKRAGQIICEHVGLMTLLTVMNVVNTSRQ